MPFRGPGARPRGRLNISRMSFRLPASTTPAAQICGVISGGSKADRPRIGSSGAPRCRLFQHGVLQRRQAVRGAIIFVHPLAHSRTTLAILIAWRPVPAVASNGFLRVRSSMTETRRPSYGVVFRAIPTSLPLRALVAA